MSCFAARQRRVDPQRCKDRIYRIDSGLRLFELARDLESVIRVNYMN